MPTRIRNALIAALVIFGATACTTLHPVPLDPVENVDSLIGISYHDAFVRFGNITAYERTYPASEAKGEFRAPIRKLFPPDDSRSAFVTIREVWWGGNRGFHSLFFRKVNDRWVAIVALKWRGHTQFENQNAWLPTE